MSIFACLSPSVRLLLLCRTLKNGHTELGVHIADVSHFVRPGSLTDEEACRRSTTVYLADRRFDMLPGILSADLCSLLSNVDRWAVPHAAAPTPPHTCTLLTNPTHTHPHLYTCMYVIPRYAVSVIWNLDTSYRVHKVWYGRTIIRSKYKLAYEVRMYTHVHIHIHMHVP